MVPRDFLRSCQDANLHLSWQNKGRANQYLAATSKLISTSTSCTIYEHAAIPITMAPSRAPSAGLLRSLRAITVDAHTCLGLPVARTFSSTSIQHAEAQVHSAESFYRNPDPATAFVPQVERRLVRRGTPPIGSRRRRVALANAGSVPFEQLPFQCFQEARKILMEDRAEKIQMIEKERAKIARLREVPDEQAGGTSQKETRMRSMQNTLEHWKILADINDPMVKKRFEDGLGMLA